MMNDGCNESCYGTTVEHNNTQKIIDNLSQISNDTKFTKNEHKTLKRAAVMIVIFENKADGLPHILLTVRSKHLRSHPGDVCFPGGRKEDGVDKTDVDTALREMEEEIGLSPFKIRVVCALPTALSANGLCVTPIICQVLQPTIATNQILDQLTLCPTEVDTAFAMPLHLFLGNGDEPMKQLEWDGTKFLMRTYYYNDTYTGRRFRIWGFTAHVAHAVAKLSYTSQKLNHTMNVADLLSIMNEEQASSSTTNSATIDNNSNQSDENCYQVQQKNRQQEGYLHLLVREEKIKPYWVRRYFVLTGGQSNHNHDSIPVLHHFLSQSDSNKKIHSATKKNRLLLHSSIVENLDLNKTNVGNESWDNLFYFQISAYNGRVLWQVAAEDQNTFHTWKESLTQCGCMSKDDK